MLVKDILFLKPGPWSAYNRGYASINQTKHGLGCVTCASLAGSMAVTRRAHPQTARLQGAPAVGCLALSDDELAISKPEALHEDSFSPTSGQPAPPTFLYGGPNPSIPQARQKITPLCHDTRSTTGPTREMSATSYTSRNNGRCERSSHISAKP